MRHVIVHVACLLFVFLYRRLAVPPLRHGYEACHIYFLRRAGCCKGKGAETKKDVRFAGWPPVTVEGAKNEETRVTNFDCMRYLLMDA